MQFIDEMYFMQMAKYRILLVIVAVIFITTPAFATSLNFDPVPNAMGYVVSWGQISGGPYSFYKDVGPETTVTFEELGVTAYTGTWYFVCQGYNEYGLSEYSNEIQNDFTSSSVSGCTISGGRIQ